MLKTIVEDSAKILEDFNKGLRGKKIRHKFTGDRYLIVGIEPQYNIDGEPLDKWYFHVIQLDYQNRDGYFTFEPSLLENFEEIKD